MNLIRSIKIIICIALVFFTACCGSQEKKPVYKNGDAITITGNVSMAGNEPFTRMVIRSSGGNEAFLLPKEFKKTKNDLIGKYVSVTGKVEVRELKSGDHKYTIYEYHIIPDKIEEFKNQSLK